MSRVTPRASQAVPVPPVAVIRALRQYDPELRVRWGVRTALWFIERKLPPRHRQLLLEKPNPFKSPRGFDVRDGWAEGYVHVLSVHPALIENVALILQELAKADAWLQGGMKKVADALDEYDQQQEAVADRHIANEIAAATSDAWFRLGWLQKRTVSTFVPEPRVEPAEGFIIRDWRQRHEEIPA